MSLKTVEHSKIVVRQLVLPNDTNMRSTLFGGKLMQWMDSTGAMAASKHTNTEVATVHVDGIQFHHPIFLGNTVRLNAVVTRAFNTSMEVKIEAYAEDFKNQTCIKSNDAFFTYVAIDDQHNPISISPIKPQTEEEKKNYEEADFRRKLRLFLTGKLKSDGDKEWVKKQLVKFS